jgi:hypothetical protein
MEIVFVSIIAIIIFLVLIYYNVQKRRIINIRRKNKEILELATKIMKRILKFQDKYGYEVKISFNNFITDKLDLEKNLIYLRKISQHTKSTSILISEHKCGKNVKPEIFELATDIMKESMHLINKFSNNYEVIVSINKAFINKVVIKNKTDQITLSVNK